LFGAGASFHALFTLQLFCQPPYPETGNPLLLLASSSSSSFAYGLTCDLLLLTSPADHRHGSRRPSAPASSASTLCPSSPPPQPQIIQNFKGKPKISNFLSNYKCLI